MIRVPDDEWRLLLDLAREARGVCRRIRRGEDADVLLSALCRRLEVEHAALSHPLSQRVYAPLIVRIAEAPLTLAQIGQSLDARIATESGHSHYINGAEALDHLHRLRALADAVVVGATTVVLDNPRLTTRRVAGRSPVRVIIDPHGRVPASRRVFDAAAPSLVLRASSPGTSYPQGHRRDLPPFIPIEPEGGLLRPPQVLRALHERELLTVLIEGGGATISAFLRAGAVQRLHVLVAPLLIGPGRTAFQLPAVDRLDDARRFSMTAHPLGEDVLLDCVLEGVQG